MNIIEDEAFTKVSAANLQLQRATFENCSFTNCDFANGNLANIIFADCIFEGCNLALCDVKNTGFQHVTFKDCKLSGIDLSKTRDFLFEVHAVNCIMDNAIFYRCKNKGAKFNGCSMVETDFTEADFTNVIFDNCNLNRAFFNRTQLKGADFSSSYNYTIDPDMNFIKKAKFSLHGLPALLSKYDIVIK